ncbi:MAG: ribbon-helix-helix protein, CopG family [Gammaproteobacteria bacterium]|nr:ribbon-helix-helix protein, CopG family [Gammaproteobacteria bacterium]
MVAKKTAALNIRVDPDLKEAIRLAAKREHRSIANMVEMLIRNHCAESGISIPEQTELPMGEQNE